jgi:hypothetical protein
MPSYVTAAMGEWDLIKRRSILKERMGPYGPKFAGRTELSKQQPSQSPHREIPKQLKSKAHDSAEFTPVK